MRSIIRRHLVTVVAVVIAVVVTAGVPLAAGSNNATWIKSGWKNGPVALPADFGTIAALRLPRGKYAVSAKLWLWNDSGGTLVSDCRLQFAGESDYVEEETPNVEHEAISLQLVGSQSSPGDVLLRCRDTRASGGVEANWIKITAIRASKLVNVQMN